MGSQERQMEGTVQEDALGEEAPVHSPLEEKLAAEVKGAGEVADWVLQQERQAQDDLQRGEMSAEQPRLTPSLHSGC